MAASPVGHPMERLLCVREKVHDASSTTRMNENAPPPQYHLDLHFPSITHRPFYYAELVRLKNVIAFREGTAAPSKWQSTRVAAEIKGSTRSFMRQVKAACEKIDKPTAKNDRFNIFYDFHDARQQRPKSWPEPKESREKPCSSRCCSGEPEPDLDRVIYRFMGEARPNMCLLEAVHFEIFLPDRLDLRFLHVPYQVVDKFNLKEGMLVWLASTALECESIRSRCYSDVADECYVSWSVDDLIGLVCEDKETWNLSFQICANMDDTDPQQSAYLAGVCSRFPFPIFGCAALLQYGIDPKKVTSAKIAKREAAWLYSVEPPRNLSLYKDLIILVNSSSTQSGYRVDELSTTPLEDSVCADEHLRWFHEKRLSSADFVRKMEQSLSFGTALARVDCRSQEVECFGEFQGHLLDWDPPEVALYPEQDPPMHHHYAILTFYSAVSTKQYSISIDRWDRNETYLIMHGRPSRAIEELGKQMNGIYGLPCAVHFASSPTSAIDALLRSNLDNPDCVQLPAVIADIYDVSLPPRLEASEIPARSRRILASSMGPILAKTRAVRFACAHPATSFAVIGDEGEGKTSTAAAIALATPRSQKKLLVTTSRHDARALWEQLVKLIYTDEEYEEMRNPERATLSSFRALSLLSLSPCETPCSSSVQKQLDNLPKHKKCAPTSLYEDSSLITPVEREMEMKEFFCWPTNDIVIATIDTILQVVHHRCDSEDPLHPFLNEVHTLIIDNAETVTEAYFYCFVKMLLPNRVVLVGDHMKAAKLSAALMKQAARPILDGIVTYIRPHSLPVLQLKRSEERERARAAFFVHAPIDEVLLDGLNEYTKRVEAAKLAEVLELLRQCRVPLNNVAVLTMDARHRLMIKHVLAEHDNLPEVHVFDDFVGKVRPVVIILVGWLARCYWDNTFKETYSTLYLDMLFIIGCNNFLGLRGYSSLEAKRCLVERKLSDFQKKKKKKKKNKK